VKGYIASLGLKNVNGIKMINSKKKGKVGELELAHKFTELGFPAHRSQQFKGSGDSADVRFNDEELNKLLHIECKRSEQLNIEEALQQAERDRALGQLPVVCHRKNRDQWKITIRLEDFIEMFKIYLIKK
jgi:Holliday junction resolvase